MWNSEFKDQLCPWGRANRAGKQETVRAAGPGIKGSGRGGREWVQACGSPESGSAAPGPFSSVGAVCRPLSIVPVQQANGRKEEKHMSCQRWLELLHSGGVLPRCPLAFQGDSLTSTVPPPHKGSRRCSHQCCRISRHPPSPGPCRPPRSKSKGSPVLGCCLGRETGQCSVAPGL